MKAEKLLKPDPNSIPHNYIKLPEIPRRRLSLRLKASLITVAISTISIVLLGIATYQINKETLNKQIKERQASTAEMFADEINNFLLERYSDIENLSKEAIFIEPKLRDLTDIDDRQRYLNFYLSFAKGIYNNIIFLDFQSDRVIIAGEQNEIIYPKEEYFTAAIGSQFFISQPKKNERGETIIAMSAPVKDRVDDNIIGIVKTSIPISALEKIIKNYERDENIYLINDRNEIFVTSNQEIKNNILRKTIAVKNIFPTLDLDKIQTASEGRVSIGQENAEGEKNIIAYAAVPQIEELPDLGWYILIEKPESEALKAQYEIKTIFIIGTLATIIIVSSITIIIAHFSVKSLEKITAAVEKIARGKLGTRLKFKGNDELAILAAQIDRMADKTENLIKIERENTEKFSDRNNTIVNLLNLIRNEVLVQGNLQETAQKFTSEIAQTLQLESASIWLYNESKESLTCLDRYLLKQQEHSSGQTISIEEFPEYCQDLPLEKLAISQETIEPQTETTLNIPIRTAPGTTVGILRCDRSQTAIGKWQTEDLSFARSIASLISLALEGDRLENEVEHLLEVACSIEEGDLTAKAKVSEHLTGLVADTLNRSSETTSKIISQLQQKARDIQQETNKHKQTANQPIDRCDRQTRAVIELAQLNDRVQQIAENFQQEIQQTNKSLFELGNSVARGETVLFNLGADIEILQQRSDRIVQQIKILGEFLTLADRFVEDRSQIASLTQVLAMNASLIAARASEQKDPAEFALVSRQFESIAKRVSGLAQKTDRGLVTLERRSSEIHKAVSEIEVEVKNLVRSVPAITTAVEKSEQVFSHLETVSAIASSSDQTVARSSQSIINTTRSMAEIIENIGELAHEIAKLTQDNNTSTEIVRNRSKQLLETIEFFKVIPPPEQNNSHILDSKFKK